MEIFGIIVTDDMLEKTEQMIRDNGGTSLRTTELNILDKVANGMLGHGKVYGVAFIADQEQYEKILIEGDKICNKDEESMET